jgi:hypothetical protein
VTERNTVTNQQQHEHPIQRAETDALPADHAGATFDVWANTNMWDNLDDDDNVVRGVD